MDLTDRNSELNRENEDNPIHILEGADAETEEMQQKNKKLRWIILLPVFFVAALLIFLFGINHFSIEMSVPDGYTVYAEYGEKFELPDISAEYKASLIPVLNKELMVSHAGNVNLTKLGDNEIVYYAGFRGLRKSITVHVIVRDTTAPEITLTAAPDYYTSPNAVYTEEGFSAYDLYDGDLTDQVERTQTHDWVLYKVTDSCGNTTSMFRQIIYKDTTAPELTLNGASEMEWAAGTAFIDPGACACDDCDGDITELIQVDGNVDTEQAGDYTLTYTIADQEGNSTSLTRLVRVIDDTE